VLGGAEVRHHIELFSERERQVEVVLFGEGRSVEIDGTVGMLAETT